jgi:hypothetical protein
MAPRDLAGIAAAIATLEDARRPWLLDGSRLEDLDTAAAFLLLRRFHSLGVSAADVGLRQMPAGPECLLALVRERMTQESTPPATARHRFLERVGYEATKLARPRSRRARAPSSSATWSRDSRPFACRTRPRTVRRGSLRPWTRAIP